MDFTVIPRFAKNVFILFVSFIGSDDGGGCVDAAVAAAAATAAAAADVAPDGAGGCFSLFSIALDGSLFFRLSVI